MCLLSNEQVLKRAINDAIFTKETIFELDQKSFINFYFEFEYRKHRAIKRDAKN